MADISPAQRFIYDLFSTRGGTALVMDVRPDFPLGRFPEGFDDAVQSLRKRRLLIPLAPAGTYTQGAGLEPVVKGPDADHTRGSR